MPKYVTAETMFICGFCALECAVRELKSCENDDTIRSCPRCEFATAYGGALYTTIMKRMESYSD